MFGLGLVGKSKAITAQDRTNCYIEISEAGEKHSQVSLHGIPGLTLFLDQGATNWRGLRTVSANGLVYGVHRNTFYEINAIGTATAKGNVLTDTGPVSISDNGLEVMVVDGTYGYIYTIATGVLAQISDPDFPAKPTTVTVNAGRFLVQSYSSARYYGSGLYAGSTWDALHFKTAESDPDVLKAIHVQSGIVIAFGESSTEFHANVGGAGFPYQQIPGSTKDFGLAAVRSITDFLQTTAFLYRGETGHIRAGVLSGYDVQRISNQEWETEINGYSTVLDAEGYSWSVKGHDFYQVNFPAAGKSWIFDAATRVWSRMKSYGYGNLHRGQLCVRAFEKQLVSDRSNGKIYAINPAAMTENGDTIEMELIGKHATDDGNRMRADSLRLWAEQGVGTATGQGVNPQIMLGVSRDGGHSWDEERFGSLGKTGEYKTMTEFRRLGVARDFVFRARITDPVKRVITAASLRGQGGLS